MVGQSRRLNTPTDIALSKLKCDDDVNARERFCKSDLPVLTGEMGGGETPLAWCTKHTG